MNSLLKKRLPGILAAVLVALAVGAAGAPASAATADTSSGATISYLTKKQKKAKKKALKKCKKKKSAKKRKKCKKQVKKKYKRIARNNPPPIGKTWQVSVGAGGNFYAPSLLNIKLNDAVNWSWANTTGSEPHNVTLVSGPSGVDRNAFTSQLTSDQSYRFKRQFTKPGAYSFVCNIHVLMTMSVNVSK
jgi:plastocyanin